MIHTTRLNHVLNLFRIADNRFAEPLQKYQEAKK